MSKFVEFPQRQHEEFSQLVYQSITEEAKNRDMLVADYIQRIYFCDENPAIFTQKKSLLTLYRRYTAIIESSLSSLNQNLKISDHSKSYLCYRIYLHSLTVEYGVMSVIDAQKNLIHSIREFYYARGRILTLGEEVKILDHILALVNTAPKLKASQL